MPESLKQISLLDWLKGLVYIIGLALLAGMWYQDKNIEAEVFSDRLTSLSGRINSLEEKQATVISDVADVKSEIKIIAKDLSFLSQTIQQRGVERDRQLAELQEGQQDLAAQTNKRFEEMAQQLANQRVWMARTLRSSEEENPSEINPFGRSR